MSNATCKKVGTVYHADMKISERIEKSRRSDLEISNMVGVAAPVVWRWRRDKATPHLRFVAALADAIGCEPADLIPPAPAR